MDGDSLAAGVLDVHDGLVNDLRSTQKRKTLSAKRQGTPGHHVPLTWERFKQRIGRVKRTHVFEVRLQGGAGVGVDHGGDALDAAATGKSPAEPRPLAFPAPTPSSPPRLLLSFYKNPKSQFMRWLWDIRKEKRKRGEEKRGEGDQLTEWQA